jgi:hypothetical protein
VRTGAVLGAAWFAYPALVRLSWRGGAILTGAIVFTAWRPGLAFAAVPALLWVAWGRNK